MVRRRSCAVSNHDLHRLWPILRDAALRLLLRMTSVLPRVTTPQPCICNSDDIRPLLSVCVGLAPVAPPAPLVVFCRNFCSDCWNAVAALVVFDDDGAFACACDCDAANALELPTADAVMMSSPKRKPICHTWLEPYG